MKLPKLSPLLFAVLSLSIIGIAAFLRLVNLDRLPSSLYWEEVALGYDAYSIAQTGRDHHGQSFPVVAFTSFGDYKPSGYFYAVVPFISLLGMNEWSVRLPSALAGISIVIGVGVLGSYLAKKIWKEDGKTPQQYAFLLGMLFSTFSPWLLQFSRGGWEVNLATAFLLWSVITALAAFERKVTRKKLLLLATATLLAALSMYVYHATRIIAPLLIAALFVMDWTAEQHLRQINVQLLKKRLLPLLLPGILFVLLISPLLLSSKSTTTQQRFAETSIASDGEYVRESNEFRDLAGNSLASKIFAHRYLFLAKHVSQAFFNHFTLDFLVISGDANPRHSTGFTGILLLPDSIWLCIGSLFFIILAYTRKELRPLLLFFLWWLVIGILPASITKASPHALRILPTAPVFMAVISIGALQAMIWLREKTSARVWSAALLFIGIALFTFWTSYWRFYTRIYRIESQADWQYGYKQMVSQLNQIISSQHTTPVYITREYGRPAMYYWFYSQTDPREVQAADATAHKDQGEFLSFKNIEFIHTVNEAKPGIIVSSLSGYEQLLKQHPSIQKLSEVRDDRGKVVWILSQYAQ